MTNNRSDLRGLQGRGEAERGQQEQGTEGQDRPVGEHSGHERPLRRGAEDGVEGDLDVAQERQDGVDEQHHRHRANLTGRDVADGLLDVALHRGLQLRRAGHALHGGAKAFEDGEDDRQQRHDRQQGVVGQCLGVQLDVVIDLPASRQENDPDVAAEPAPHPRHLGHRVVVDERLRGCGRGFELVG